MLLAKHVDFHCRLGCAPKVHWSTDQNGSIASSSSNTKLEANSGRSCVGFQRLEASPSFSNFERTSLSTQWAHQPHVQWHCFCTQRLFVSLKRCWTRHSNACWCQMPTVSRFLMRSAEECLKHVWAQNGFLLSLLSSKLPGCLEKLGGQHGSIASSSSNTKLEGGAISGRSYILEVSVSQGHARIRRALSLCHLSPGYGCISKLSGKDTTSTLLKQSILSDQAVLSIQPAFVTGCLDSRSLVQGQLCQLKKQTLGQQSIWLRRSSAMRRWGRKNATNCNLPVNLWLGRSQQALHSGCLVRIVTWKITSEGSWESEATLETVIEAWTSAIHVRASACRLYKLTQHSRSLCCVWSLEASRAQRTTKKTTKVNQNVGFWSPAQCFGTHALQIEAVGWPNFWTWTSLRCSNAGEPSLCVGWCWR